MKTIEQGSMKRSKMLKNIHITLFIDHQKIPYLKTNLFTFVFFKRSAFTLRLWQPLRLR